MAQAHRIIRRRLGAEGPGAVFGRNEKVIYPVACTLVPRDRAGQPLNAQDVELVPEGHRLAWCVRAEAPSRGARDYLVDARNGEVLLELPAHPYGRASTGLRCGPGPHPAHDGPGHPARGGGRLGRLAGGGVPAPAGAPGRPGFYHLEVTAGADPEARAEVSIRVVPEVVPD